MLPLSFLLVDAVVAVVAAAVAIAIVVVAVLSLIVNGMSIIRYIQSYVTSFSITHVNCYY